MDQNIENNQNEDVAKGTVQASTKAIVGTFVLTALVVGLGTYAIVGRNGDDSLATVTESPSPTVTASAVVETQTPLPSATPTPSTQAQTKTYTSTYFTIQHSPSVSVSSQNNSENNSTTVSFNQVSQSSDGGGSPKFLTITTGGLTGDGLGCKGDTRKIGTVTIKRKGLSDISIDKCVLDGGYFGEGQTLVMGFGFYDVWFSIRADFYDRNKASIDAMLATLTLKQ